MTCPLTWSPTNFFTFFTCLKYYTPLLSFVLSLDDLLEGNVDAALLALTEPLDEVVHHHVEAALLALTEPLDEVVHHHVEAANHGHP